MSSLTPIDATRLREPAQLVEFMAAGGKPRERWVVGTEHEKLGWWPDRGTYPTFEGDRGIGRLLESLAAEAGWEATRDGDDIIALARDRATITLEPGGQLELSGAPLRSLLDTEAELDAHLAEVAAYSAPLGITWSGLGIAPVRTADEMPRMPKPRYGIMRRYLPTRGRLAPYMMHSTCTVQANYDYADEGDALRKLRASLYLQPLVMAAFANSTVVHGQITPERTWRARVWEETDPDRYFYPPSFLEPGAGFREYVEWALDVPMFFIYRDGRYLDCAGLPFRELMARGYQGHEANLGDFALHLSTLFPDARLKQHLEVRGADMGPRAYVLALPALHAGVLYDDEALDRCLALFADVGHAELAALRRAVPLEGFDARLGGASVHELLTDVLRLAREGLGRWEPAAVRLLDPLAEAVAARHTPADRVRDLWSGDAGALMAATRIA